VKTVFENTLYIWKYFVLNIRVDSSRPLPPPQTVLLSYDYVTASVNTLSIFTHIE